MQAGLCSICMPDAHIITTGSFIAFRMLTMMSAYYVRTSLLAHTRQVQEILSKMSERRQTLLFSATLPRTLADFARAGLSSPQLIQLDTERRISPDLALAFFTVRKEEKLGALLHLLRDMVAADQLTILFAATRHHVEYLHALCARENIPSACVYGSMDQVRLFTFGCGFLLLFCTGCVEVGSFHLLICV